MKTYPSIGGASSGHYKPCYLFLKYDGSNIRCEWSRKKGWYKFGTRRGLLDEGHEVLGPAIPLFLDKYADELEKVFKNSKEKTFRGVQNVTVFCEFFGANSFAGQHKENDKKDIVLFDVNPIKRGILGPKQFLDFFGHLSVAEVIYQGNFNKELVNLIREEKISLESKYEVEIPVPEGVICKGGVGHELWMCKIKTNRYKDLLKEVYESGWENYWE